MKLKLAIASLAFLAQPVVAQDADISSAPPGVYDLDASHTYVVITYNHLGFSRPTLQFDDISGTLTLDGDALGDSTLDVTIQAASVDGGDATFYDHLTGEGFFDVANHPEITFGNVTVSPTGPNSGVLEGDLTIKGVTKRVSLDAVLNQVAKNPIVQKDGIGVTASTLLMRSDFGLDAYAPAVSDEVELTINAEFYLR